MLAIGQTLCCDRDLQHVQEQLSDCWVSSGAVKRFAQVYGLAIHRNTSLEEREVCLAAENAILYSFFNLKSTNGTLNCRASLLSMPLRIGVQSEPSNESELAEENCDQVGLQHIPKLERLVLLCASSLLCLHLSTNLQGVQHNAFPASCP